VQGPSKIEEKEVASSDVKIEQAKKANHQIQGPKVE
jgi:hypothetical protein